MSIVTLRSTEDFGGASANAGAAVNFQNHFKDPIDVKRDDTIQITSVTINQDITGFKIGAGNNEFQFRIGDASPNGETPFFQLHRVRIPEGTYDGVELANLMATQLNNSLTLFGYTFTVAFVAATKNFSIDMTQSVPSSTINTAVQVEGSRVLQPATFLPQYPLCPVNPGVANLFTAFFSGENNNPNFTPSAAEQTILLGVAKNHILSALTPSSNPVSGKAYQYAFNRPIDERLGEHNVSINPSFALAAVDLLQYDYTPGTGPPTTIQKHVQIDNILGPGVNRVYTATATGPTNIANTLPYYYKLEDTTKYIGLPEAVALVSPNAITGINSSTNNVLSSGGDTYNVGDVMQCSNAVPDKPIAEVLAVSPAGGSVTAYRILYPGSGFTAGQALTFPNNRPGATPMIVTMGVGGFRTSAAGTNSAANPPPAANIVVGQTYKCSFPSGSTENPLAGNTLPITRVQLDNDANEIDLNVKVESIDATTRQITGVSFVSVGLKAHSPNFVRLLKTISDGQSRVMLQDGNGNLHTPQASWISISQLRSNGDDAPLYFGNTMDGLCYLTDVAANQPLTPAGAQVAINGVATSCVFSMMANDGVKTRAYIKNVGRLSQINVDATSALYGNYLDPGVGLRISRYDNATGNLLDLRNQTKKTKVDYEVNLTRGQLVQEMPAAAYEDGDDFFCRVTNDLYHLRTDGANRGGLAPIQTTRIQVGIRNYGPGDTIDTTGPSTEVIVYDKFMNTVQIPNYDMSKIDKIGWGINNLNQLSWTLDQDAPAAGWVPITHTFFQAGAVDADANPIRESIFPLLPVMKFSQGVSIEEQLSVATPPVASQFIPGQSYTNIQGKYHTRQAAIYQEALPADSYSQMAALNTFIQPPGILSSLLEEPSTDPTIANQTGAGLTTLVQTPLLYKFGDVLPSQTTAADNPVPGVGGATSVSIGAIDRDPNTANLALTMGMDEVVNLNNFKDTQAPQATSAQPGELISGAPTVFLEFPDFNIQGYSGAAKDKFPIVATMPTEEWNTGLDKGTLHYKPLFPLPVEVNLPEDKKLYSMTARIRNLDGTLANNLKNPTTITFYKKPRESRAIEDALNRANQRRSEQQDQNISMRINDFPIGTQ